MFFSNQKKTALTQKFVFPIVICFRRQIKSPPEPGYGLPRNKLSILWGGRHESPISGTGKMPIPQENLGCFFIWNSLMEKLAFANFGQHS
jgi:hypothetical protein